MNATRHTSRLLVALVTAAALGLMASPADAATTASFGNGVLSVFGDGLDNNITISRDAAGKLLVNNGAVNINGGTATVGVSRWSYRLKSSRNVCHSRPRYCSAEARSCADT